MRKNPIPFDSNDMSLRQVKACVDSLSHIFDSVINGASNDQLGALLRQELKSMKNRYAVEEA